MDAVTKGVAVAIPLVIQRLESSAPLSEDSFRYLVFHGLYKAGVDIMRVALEYPHPSDPYKSKRAKIDTVILDDEKVAPETAIEFKYIREPGAITTDAGELLADFAKLRDFPNVHRFVTLLTDGKLWRYLNNANNGLNWLFSPLEQKISDANVPSTPSLREPAGDGAFSSQFRTQMIASWDMGNDHRLFVWRVMA